MRRLGHMALALLLLRSVPAWAAPPEPGPAPLVIEPPPEVPAQEPPPAEPEPEPAPLDTGPPPPTGDVVETIDLGTGTAPVSPPVAPPPADTFQISGWARTRVAVGLTDTGASSSDTSAVPFDRLTAQSQLHLRLRYARGRRFEAVVSGLLTASFFEQDSTPPSAFDLFNGTTRTAYEADLREAYLGVFWSRFDLRVGQQRIPWGRGDAFTPNDVINPYDLRDRLLTETEVLRLPTLAVRGDLSLGPLLLSLVYTPFFVPDRFDSYGGNWALLQPDAPSAYLILANRLSSSLNIDTSLYPLLQPLLQQTALPPANLAGSAGGLRASLALHRLDLDAFYHYGYDFAPYLQVGSSFTSSLSQIDVATASTSTLSSLLLAGIGESAVSATYVRRHHAGLAIAAPAGPVLLRGDVAYDSQTVQPGADLQGVLCPSFQAVAAVEYQRGDLGKFLSLEAHYQYLDIPSGSSLLFQATHNADVAALARWTILRDHLQFELRGLVGLYPVSYLLRPQVAYRYRGLEVRAGLTIPGGEDQSLGHYYRRNLTAYTIARYSF